MTLRLQPDQPSLPAGGGTRYVLVTLPAEEPIEPRTALVIDGSLIGWQSQIEALVGGSPMKFAFAHTVRGFQQFSELADWKAGPGNALHEAWLRGCHAIAPEQADGRPGHCILVTPGLGDADPEALAEQAAAIWEQTAIATSVVAVGDSADEELLKALAWRGGGSYHRLEEGLRLGHPPARNVLEFTPAEVEFLTPTRSSSTAGRPTAVVNGRVLVAVTFRGNAREMKVRLNGGEWHKLRFSEGAPTDPPDPEVMALVPAPPRPTSFATAEGAAELVGRFVPASASWPTPVVEPDRDQVVDLFRGCLIGGAVATALGRVLIGLEPTTIRSRYGSQGLTHYEPWQPDLPESVGMVSGDTQITRALAQALVDGRGCFDPELFVARFLPLVADNRGLGQACESAGAALTKGLPWWKAGQSSAGNGAALRVAPLGLLWALSPQRIQLHREAVLSALVTHTHPMGVAATVVMALGVAYCVRQRLAGRPLEAAAFLGFLADAIEGLEREPVAERRLGGRATTLCAKIREVEGLLDRPPEEALMVTWNGAFALESIPAALYCFLKFPGDPRQVIITAINGGHDADSVGSMAGQLAGAWAGAAVVGQAAPAWWEGLEGREELLGLADRLAELALDKL